MADTNPIDDESINIVVGQVDPPDIAQPIRTEDQTAMKGGVQEIFHAAGPPSYDSSVPLLSSSQQAGDEEVDTEAQAEGRAADQKRAYAPLTLVAWLKFFVGMAPVLTVCLSWAVLGSAGVDPLAFSLLSFFLLIGLFWFTVLFACVRILIAKRVKARNAPPSSSSENQNLDDDAWKAGMFISLGILGIYVMFYGIIWGWAVSFSSPATTSDSVWHTYRVWRDLQAKMDAPDVLSKLAVCLQEAIPNRNAAIADISVCLRAMGMDDSYVE